MTIDKDIMVLANPEIANLQLGYCFSGCRTLAAALSTAGFIISDFSFCIS
jgi:Na+(H+)/acetate symporter ActP